VICFVMVVPILWVVLESFHGSDVFGSAFSTFSPTVSNYRFIFAHTRIASEFKNSFIACGVATVVSVPLTAMAAYGYSRFQFRGRYVLFFGVLVTQILPATAVVIPLYKVWSLGHLFSNLAALGVAYAAFNMALGILLLKNFFDNIPRDLDSAGLVDGCNRRQIFWHIVGPLVAPAVAATSVFVFVNAWQDYLLASSLITDTAHTTLNVGLYSLEGATTTNWGAILATSVLASIPSVALFAFAQKYFVRVASGGVKG
jgi:multiple sugar transport system permease protein